MIIVGGGSRFNAGEIFWDEVVLQSTSLFRCSSLSRFGAGTGMRQSTALMKKHDCTYIYLIRELFGC